MKQDVQTDDWWESGLFESEEDYKEFIAMTREKLHIELFERSINCPEKQRTPRRRVNKPEVADHDQEPHKPEIENHDHRVDSLKKRRRPSGDDDHLRKEKHQRKAKANLVEGPEPPPEIIPRWLREAVEELGGHGQRLLIQKRLKKSDVKSGQSRISMPVRQLRGPDDFLREEELRKVLRRKDDDEKRIEGLDMTFVEAGSRTSVLSLRKWEYGSSSSYVFAGKVKDFVKRNGLKAGETVHIRFFRCRDGSPRFALINLAAETASSSSSSSSAAAVTAEENQATATDDPAPLSS